MCKEIAYTEHIPPLETLQVYMKGPETNDLFMIYQGTVRSCTPEEWSTFFNDIICADVKKFKYKK